MPKPVLNQQSPADDLRAEIARAREEAEQLAATASVQEAKRRAAAERLAALEASLVAQNVVTDEQLEAEVRAERPSYEEARRDAELMSHRKVEAARGEAAAFVRKAQEEAERAQRARLHQPAVARL